MIDFRTLLRPATFLRLCVAVPGILLGIWLQYASTPAAVLADEWLRDQFITLHATTSPESRVVLVDIDESSLTSEGPWPWPRTRLADLLETLIGTYGARAVALDIVLPERADEAGDMRLAMLAQHGPVVLAQAFDYAPHAKPLRVGQLQGGISRSGVSNAIPATGFIANHAGFANAAHTGNIGFVPDQDGTLRRLPVLTAFEDRLYPTLSLALVNTGATDTRGSALQPPYGGFVRVPYDRNWNGYTVVKASDILHLRAPADLVTNRLAIVSSSSLGLSDRVSTPLHPSISGMMVHAAMTSHWLDVQDGKAPSAWPGKFIAVGFSILVVLLSMFCLPRLSAIANAGLLTAAFASWLLLAYVAAPHDARFSTTAPFAVILFLLIVAIPLQWQLTQHRSRRLLGTLRQYVAGAVVDELLRLDLKDPLAPRHLHVTTLIADMEGYTTHVEALPAEDAAALTRDFLACLTRPVLNSRGTLDKFTGDGLVAFWGAPLPVDDHADLALDAARGILEEVRQFNDARGAAGLPRLRVRIGIESGIAMAGNFGSASRGIYTAVGDSVNVASRLESIAKTMPHDVVIGAGAAALARRHRLVQLGEVTLRGKEKPTMLYTLEAAE